MPRADYYTPYVVGARARHRKRLSSAKLKVSRATAMYPNGLTVEYRRYMTTVAQLINVSGGSVSDRFVNRTFQFELLLAAVRFRICIITLKKLDMFTCTYRVSNIFTPPLL